MKIDLKDVTFNIPYYRDSLDRQKNLEFLVEYLTYHFDTNILIKEIGKDISFHYDVRKESSIKYIFEQSDNSIFHRTKVLNDLCMMSKTPIIVNQDVDCILPIEAYIIARDSIKTGMDVVYPYDGRFQEISREKLPNLRKNYDFNSIKLEETHCLNPNSVGGIIFENREKFIEVGGEPETFFGWGFEDNYRVALFKKFGLKVARTRNYLLHIDHWRGENSGPENPHYRRNLLEYLKTNHMTKEQLVEYIKTWHK